MRGLVQFWCGRGDFRDYTLSDEFCVTRCTGKDPMLARWERCIVHVLENIKGGEEDELGLVVETHSLNVGFEDLENLFPILISRERESINKTAEM